MKPKMPSDRLNPAPFGPSNFTGGRWAQIVTMEYLKGILPDTTYFFLHAATSTPSILKWFSNYSQKAEICDFTHNGNLCDWMICDCGTKRGNDIAFVSWR